MKFVMACLTAAACLFSLSAAAPAAAASKTLNVTVWQLCDNIGANCAPLGPTGNNFFAAETNAIWAQADIAVNFTLGGAINSTNSMNIETELEFSYFVNYDPYSVNMYLVNSLPGGAYGLGYEGAGGLAVDMDSLLSFSQAGRFDTIAHELGHNLGLLPASLGGDAGGHSSIANQLMARGDIRRIGSSIADIAPYGAGYDYLPASQVALARQSRLLVATAPVPEPGEWAMMIAGLSVVGFAARRTRARRELRSSLGRGRFGRQALRRAASGRALS